jgi:hypothetical protein
LAASTRSRIVTCDRTTPFEAPVVPEVKRMNAALIGARSAGVSRAAVTGAR